MDLTDSGITSSALHKISLVFIIVSIGCGLFIEAIISIVMGTRAYPGKMNRVSLKKMAHGVSFLFIEANVSIL